MNRAHSARIANAVLGVWLILSSLLWRDTVAQFASDWIIGVLITLVSLAGFWAPSLRYVNTCVAVWLFLSAWWMRWEHTATFWNTVVVAALVFAFSLAGPARGRTS